MKKKLFYSILLTAFVWTAMILTANAATYTYGWLYYSMNNYYEVTITDCSSYATSVTIPETIHGAPVKSIGVSAFSGCTGLTSITIPDSVTSIGSFAFYNTAYYRNTNNWENGVLYIGNHLIDAETTVTAHEVKAGTKTIAGSAFYNCASLTSITIPDSVTSIGNGAFYECTSLRSITIPDSVTSIDYEAFYSCSGLTSVTIGNGVTSIGSSAFYNCTGLTSILWNAGNVSDFSSDNDIFAYAGTAGDGIEVVFGDEVEKIPAYAFYPYWSSSYAPKLKSVTIGKNVTSIGSSAFRGCASLESVYITDLAAYLNITYGDSYSAPMFYAHKLYLNKKRVVNVNIPQGVEKIPMYAFNGCNSITSITIPDSVTSIGEDAFYGCASLTSVTIPDSVTSIGSYAFYNCTGLTSILWNAGNVSDFSSYNYIFAYAGTAGDGIEVVFGDEVEKIPAYAFCTYSSYKQPKLKSVTIGKNVKSIGDSAFSGCTGLTSITIPDSVTNIGASAFEYCDGLTSITIPDSVTSIGSSAFEYCDGLTSITIPDSVTSIGSSAFYSCDSLESVYITDLAAYLNITYEDSYSAPMYYADELYLNGELVTGELVIPAGVEQIPMNAFGGCDSLTSITIPDSVTSIGSSAFAYCTALKTLYWNPVKIASYGSDVFESAGNASDGIDVIFGDDVLRIPPRAFTGANIKTAALGGNVSMIDEEAFAGCTGLEKLVLPKSIWEIEINAFSGCTSLKEVEYAGSAADWTEVYIGTGNEALKSVTYKYDSKEANRLGVTMEETAAGRTFTVAPVAVEVGTVVYAAIYDENGELISRGCETVDADNYTTVETQSTPRDAVAKVFLFSGAKAQTESKTYPLS